MSDDIESFTYDAFVNHLDPPSATDTNPFGYCGEYYDNESGNIYLRARYYDTASGRFISEDPIKDGLNWYNYCAGNPLMFVDPLGLKERYLSDLVAETTGGIFWEVDYNRAKVTIDGRTKYYYINENNIVNDKIMVDDNDFYRDFDIIGEITIASCWTADNPGEFGSINSQLISGHALIYYEEYDSDLVVTYSAWNNDESIYNRPKDRDYLNDSNTSTYTKKITRNQRYRMSEYVQDRTHSVWKPYNTCANFAQNTFYVTTDILLGNTPFPKDLKNNIDRKNAGGMIVIW